MPNINCFRCLYNFSCQLQNFKLVLYCNNNLCVMLLLITLKCKVQIKLKQMLMTNCFIHFCINESVFKQNFNKFVYIVSKLTFRFNSISFNIFFCLLMIISEENKLIFCRYMSVVMNILSIYEKGRVYIILLIRISDATHYFIEQ